MHKMACTNICKYIPDKTLKYHFYTSIQTLCYDTAMKIRSGECHIHTQAQLRGASPPTGVFGGKWEETHTAMGVTCKTPGNAKVTKVTNDNKH